ncbi:endonuclease/exonuclease/phosphatase family protein [Aquihabitans daechungensis]|uniref:endonuclease/exonuclease/phosphatase family protein n=1 Tax=Aquihabitans daechungensis TaxID=1052257 RepID=UPI003BA18EBF
MTDPTDPADLEPAGPSEVRVAFWNTWLLAPRAWPGGPRMPGFKGWFAPDVDERAPLVARAVAGRFDVVALSECFEQSEQDAVARAWPDATFVPGPQRRGLRLQGSGLATLAAPGVRVVRSTQHAYRAGGDLRDSDTFATKGIQLVAVEVGDDPVPLEIISTHLIAGGDLFPIPGADDVARHHAARMRQVDELVAFIEAEHDPASPLLVVGDFNVMAHDADPALPDPQARYRDLAERLARVGLTDVWAAHGVGPGHTCTFRSAEDLPADPDERDQVDDDPDASPADAPGERIDYLWLAVPPGTTIGVDRPRRWAFTGRGVRGGPAGSLSDHLALSVTLRISSDLAPSGL